MRKGLVAGAAAALALAGFVVAPAHADVTVCHDVAVTIADQTVADQGCNVIPTTPPAPPAVR